jgi:hypothetical protein
MQEEQRKDNGWVKVEEIGQLVEDHTIRNRFVPSKNTEGPGQIYETNQPQ